MNKYLNPKNYIHFVMLKFFYQKAHNYFILENENTKRLLSFREYAKFWYNMSQKNKNIID